MFPDRVGKIILDGMQDPVTHASAPSHLAWANLLESVDETFQGFAQGCALAGPDGCPLATDTSTGQGVIQWTQNLLAVRSSVHSCPKRHLRPKQIAHDYAKSSGDGRYKSVDLVSTIHDTLYDPDQWSTFASNDFYNFYQEVMQVSGSNLTLATRSEWVPPVLERQPDQDWQDYTFQAIVCGDSIDENNITTQAVFDELVRVVKDVSPMCKWLRYSPFLQHSY